MAKARKSAKVVKFPKPKRSDDSPFIRTLVWMLDQARQGKVTGYTIMCSVVTDDGLDKVLESSMAFERRDRLMVLGAIRRMEFNFLKRAWDEDENPEPIPYDGDQD